MEESSVDHYLAIDKFLNYLVFLYVKGSPMVVAMVGASQLNSLSTTFNKVSLDLVYIPMILKWKSLKGVNALSPMKFWNFGLDLSFAKLFAVKVEITAI